jgi:hypothetical protein
VQGLARQVTGTVPGPPACHEETALGELPELYRHYLYLLARAEIGRRLQSRFESIPGAGGRGTLAYLSLIATVFISV